ncbi:caspase domain-containing protein [Hypoxylon trugodes]|uniref:caspase domain-containing protein n=1 Tax=Hypoxylon trugodes TaxID=326681 RepID=UPI00219C73F4|nr:caspase domain-containing protein [Hypoxylon trugodes]KAI1388438.1 caspase domain-containing protein [Hypoxylon trugodes]
MARLAPSRGDTWAVLVGVNWYSDDEEDNLEGCVNDVKRTKNMLEDSLQVPSEHITTLLSIDGNEANEHKPTKKNVIQAIESAAGRAKPGDLFYFHYSGHGDRVPTEYGDLKTGTNKDEVLCTLGEDITDVELGNLLDKLQEHKLIVCVVLDCCHSGGADRKKAHGLAEERRVRCRRQKSSAESSTIRGSRDRCLRGTKSRNTVPKESWFYRSRGYNLIAAAQPYEKAREYEDDNNEIYGRMTYHLLKALEALRSSFEPVTYGLLQDILEADCKAISQRSGKKQQPIYLGDRDRAVFTATVPATVPATGQRSLLAGIIHIDQEKSTVKLNKGSACNISKGDKFRIYDRPSSVFGTVVSSNSPAIEVVVTKVHGLHSQAVFCGESTDKRKVEVGCLAELSSKAKAAKVYVDMPRKHSSKVVNRLRVEWSQYVDSKFPLELEFSPPSSTDGLSGLEHEFSSSGGDFDLFVDVGKKSSFTFRNKNRELMPHVLPQRSDHPKNSIEWMKLLRHLCSYELVANLANSEPLSPPQFEFKVEEVLADGSNPEAHSSWRAHFKNNHSNALYVTILNLTPTYGIHQIFPSYTQFASSRAVEKRKEIPELLFNVVIPKSLKRVVDPSFCMRDTIKVLVSTEQTNFCHYLLPDLWDTDSSDRDEDSSPETSDDESDYSDKEDESEDDEDDEDDEFFDAGSGRSEGGNEAGRQVKTINKKEIVASWSVAEQTMTTTIVQAISS